jgi:toxin ParE1/3/4
MTFEVIVMPQADKDMRGIFEYIAFELKAPMNAANQLDRLEEQIEKLDTFPTAYSQYKDEPWFSRGLRYVSVDNYLVYFIADKEKEIVYVIRVMYSKQDSQEFLNEM